MTAVINRSRRSIEALAKELSRYIPGLKLSFPIDITDLIDLGKQGIVPEGPELASLALRKDINIPSGHTLNTKDVNTFSC